MWRKQNLESVLGIPKENRGATKHFSEIIKLQYGKKTILVYISLPIRIIVALNCL